MSVMHRPDSSFFVHFLICCDRLNNASPYKVVYLLIPATCEYGMLYGERDFTDMVKLRVLRLEHDPRISR